eukprot:comp18820_c0_seq1/m.20803 comp18820_c0_seq1/g.20803  ORF comp18820_c0_seq1/g.20803 comp18820_c0_seq1/m.20803 type:complete len:348 (-) comp18820_c0_seq1:571-1614(-)
MGSAKDARVAVLTGSNTGIGLAIAHRLLGCAKEHNIALTTVLACRNMEKAKEAQTELLTAYPDAVVELVQLDTSSNRSVLDAAAQINERYGRIDYLYLNAGIMPSKGLNLKPLLTTDLRKMLDLFLTGTELMIQDDWDTKDGNRAVFATNVFGHYLLIRELQDKLVQSKGRIIWTGSNAGHCHDLDLSDIQDRAGVNPYGRSKYAVDVLSQCLNDHLNPLGVYSYTCCPGLVVTQISLALLPWWVWMVLIFPFLWLVRLGSAGFYTYFPENGAEGLVYLSGLPGTGHKVDGKTERRKDIPNPYVKYFSRTTPLGQRVVVAGEVPCTKEEKEGLVAQLDAMVEQARRK